MDFNSDDFRDQLEAILFKMRLALIMPQSCGRSIHGSFS